MKALLSLLCIFILIQSLNAQPVEVFVTHFDKDDNVTKDTINSYWYGIDSIQGDLRRSDAFYTASKKRRLLVKAGKDDELRPFILFYENGKVMESGTLLLGNDIGLTKMYYPDGRPWAEVEYLNEVEYNILQYWNADGKKIVDKGSGTGKFQFPDSYQKRFGGEGTIRSGKKDGTWIGVGVDDSTYSEIWDSGSFVSGESKLNGRVFRYAAVDEHSVLLDHQAFQYHVVKAMKKTRCPIPSDGKIAVGVRIDKEGHIIAANIVDSYDDYKELCNIFDWNSKAFSSINWISRKERGCPVPSRAIHHFTTLSR